MSRRWRMLTVWAVLGLACGEGPTGPVQGTVTIHLSSPHADDGALLFTVTAPEGQTIDTVTAACSGCRAFMGRSGDLRVSVAVVGALPAGAVAQMVVSDTRQPSRYQTGLLEVAARSHALRSLDGYALTVER